MKKTGIEAHEAGRYIIDSGGWIEYFIDGKYADKFGKYIENANPDSVFTPTIIIYEVYKKICRDIGEEEALKAIAHIKCSTEVVDLTEEIAISSAETSLKEKLPMADAIIYTVSGRYNSILVTGDGHFKGMEKTIFFGK